MYAIHFFCLHQKGFKHLGNGLFESSHWNLTDKMADELIGGFIFLHEKQTAPPWHGGRIKGWRPADDNPKRKVIEYSVEGNFRKAVCRTGWGREQARQVMPDDWTP